MSSEGRPVPRRESPWGVPEGEHRQPKAHRCNDRAEDVIQFYGQLCNIKPSRYPAASKNLNNKPKMLVLREIHSRQFLDLSSYSGNVCAQNLGRNLRTHIPTCSWIHQVER